MKLHEELQKLEHSKIFKVARSALETALTLYTGKYATPIKEAEEGLAIVKDIIAGKDTPEGLKEKTDRFVKAHSGDNLPVAIGEILWGLSYLEESTESGCKAIGRGLTILLEKGEEEAKKAINSILEKVL